jgi:hypothetical protein
MTIGKEPQQAETAAPEFRCGLGPLDSVMMMAMMPPGGMYIYLREAFPKLNVVRRWCIR